ncbi:hypothetical protein NQ318_020623 [Aromia moschata]|uniref:Uncharacterized protein n=1 Tax=Aromia moschata TaxID=1265417 RepID=A0AAV8Z2M6_9CUCU|nr:hypothetical protein NQ318_020623 [Aromia moschata]
MQKNERDKSSERKSILKPSAEPFSRRRNLSPSPPKSALRRRDGSPARRCALETETSPEKVDEGISCDNSDDSDWENPSAHAPFGAREDAGKSGGDKRGSGRNGKAGGDSTSEGESSGGREIRNIFKNDSRLKVK